MTRLHQAIHGYSDGHRLLGASKKFAKQSERTLLIMSDLSGSSMPKGFESYLTGYGLHDAGAYAVARTWYAPEMDRPGCVWTHTFIIERSDMDELADLGAVIKLFRRPKVDQKFGAYKKAIEVGAHSKSQTGLRLDKEAQGLSSLILQALYSRPDKPVVMKAHSSSQFESLAILLWSQQWPELRMAFSFCTGSIDSRKLNRIPLDLQITPAETYTRVSRQVQGAILIGNSQSEWGTKAEEWLSVATADLNEIPDGQLTKFLKRYGRDVPGDRSSFSKLSNAFMRTHWTESRGISVAQMITWLAGEFPKSSTAKSLKLDLLGPEWAHNFRALDGNSELDVLKGLLLTHQDSAFDPKDLAIRKRASAIWTEGSKSAAELTHEVLSLDQNPIRDQFLKGAADGADDELVIRNLEGDVRLIGVLMRLNPTIGALEGVWHGPTDNQLQMFDLLVSSEAINDEAARLITSSILNSGSDELAERVIAEFGSVAIAAAIEWGSKMLESSGQPLSDAWTRSLKSMTRDVLAWMESEAPLSLSQVATVIGLLDPHSSDVQASDIEIWMPIYESRSGDIPRATYLDAMVFLLAVGFHNAGDGAGKLVSNSFSDVHESAEAGLLSYSKWSVLKDQLPHLSWWRDWDMGERLRLGLIKSFSNNNWPINEFLDATRGTDVFEAVLKSGQAGRADKQYLKKVAEHVDAGGSTADDFQKVLLTSL